MIRHPDAQHADNVMAYDNAVSALGKICQFHRDGIDASQVYQCLWLLLLVLVIFNFSSCVCVCSFSTGIVVTPLYLNICYCVTIS